MMEMGYVPKRVTIALTPTMARGLWLLAKRERRLPSKQAAELLEEKLRERCAEVGIVYPAEAKAEA